MGRKKMAEAAVTEPAPGLQEAQNRIKAGEPVSPPEQPTLPGLPAAEEEKPSQAEAVRRALADGIEKPLEIVEYAKKRWGVEVKIGSVNAAKHKAKSEGSDGQAQPTRERKASAPAAGPSLADLFRVKDLLDQVEDSEAFVKTVNQVEEMAAAVGGLDRLKAILAALEKLKG